MKSFFLLASIDRIKKVTHLIVLLFLTTPAGAVLNGTAIVESADQSKYAYAAVISQSNGDNQGTATYLGKGVFLTARHVVENERLPLTQNSKGYSSLESRASELQISDVRGFSLSVPKYMIGAPPDHEDFNFSFKKCYNRKLKNYKTSAPDVALVKVTDPISICRLEILFQPVTLNLGFRQVSSSATESFMIIGGGFDEDRMPTARRPLSFSKPSDLESLRDKMASCKPTQPSRGGLPIVKGILESFSPEDLKLVRRGLAFGKLVMKAGEAEAPNFISIWQSGSTSAQVQPGDSGGALLLQKDDNTSQIAVNQSVSFKYKEGAESSESYDCEGGLDTKNTLGTEGKYLKLSHEGVRSWLSSELDKLDISYDE